MSEDIAGSNSIIEAASSAHREWTGRLGHNRAQPGRNDFANRAGNWPGAPISAQLVCHRRRYSSTGTSLRAGHRFTAPRSSTQALSPSSSATICRISGPSIVPTPPVWSRASRFLRSQAHMSSWRGSPGWLPVFFDQVLPVFSNIGREGRIVWKGRALLPAVSEQPQAADRKRLDQRFLQPLAGQFRLGLGLPAVAQHMAELVAELIRELTPIERADIDDDPSRVRILFVKPDVRWPGRLVVDPQLRRLPVGQQSYSRQADLAHKRDHRKGIAGRRAAPLAAELQGRGKQCHSREHFCAWAALHQGRSHTLTIALCRRKRPWFMSYAGRLAGSCLMHRDAGPPLVEAEVAPILGPRAWLEEVRSGRH